jgi:hypothetical protein
MGVVTTWTLYFLLSFLLCGSLPARIEATESKGDQPRAQRNLAAFPIGTSVASPGVVRGGAWELNTHLHLILHFSVHLILFVLPARHEGLQRGLK